MGGAFPSRFRARAARATLAAGAVAILGALFVPVVRFDVPYSSVVFDRRGQLLAASIAADGQWRFPPRAEVPERFVTALLRFEDRGFRWHPGVDPGAVVRATWQNLVAGRVVSGASTLTMQVVRLSRPGNDRTVGEKLVETALAFRLELARSKDEILASWAAHAPFGGNTVGLEAACWRYFGRAPDDLTWAEAAVLAVLPNSPALLHPGRNQDRLQAKRDRLLRALHDDGAFDEETLRLALAEPLPEAPQPLPQVAPQLLGRFQAQGRSRALTTLDGDLQTRSLDVLRRHQRRQAGNGVHNLAAVVLDNDTGHLLAYHGNVFVDGEHEDYVDVAAAPRSTGSLLKPFLYEAMMADGQLLPSQLVPDTPLRIGGFAPQNFHRSFDGAVPASDALARSLNVPATALLRDYGVPTFYERLRRLGLTTLDRPSSDYGLSLVLGGAEGRLVELAGLYAALARAARGLDEPVVTPRVLADAPAHTARAPLGPGSSWLTLRAMLDVKRPGVDGSWRIFPSSRKVSWKTGTSFGFRDAWAIGTSPRFTVAVWVGNADGEGRPDLTGFLAAAPVLFELFDLLPPDPWFEQPAELSAQLVCADSGHRASPSCPRTRPELVPPAADRAGLCPHCRAIHLDDTKTWRVHGDCESVHAMVSEAWFVLPPAQERYYRLRHADYRPLPAWRPDCVEGAPEAAGPMALIHPRPHTEIYVPRELDGHLGRAVFEAAHRDSSVPIHWHLDDEYLGTTEHIHQLEVSPAPGEHTLTLVDDTGARLARTFTVLGTD